MIELTREEEMVLYTTLCDTEKRIMNKINQVNQSKYPQIGVKEAYERELSIVRKLQKMFE